MIRVQFFVLLLVFTCFSGYGQYFQKEKILIQKVNNAGNDSLKVIALGELADFYYIYRAETRGDSTLNLQLALAEELKSKNLVMTTLFDNVLDRIPNWTSSETFDRALLFLTKGLQYAREAGKNDYEALSHVRIASVYRKRGQYDKGLEHATMALSSAMHSFDDSLRCIVLLETGDIFLEKGNPVDAYKNYNNAFDIAYRIGNVFLQSQSYHHIAVLYDEQHLKDKDQTKKILLKSLELNKTHRNTAGLLQDYKNLARTTDDKNYLIKYTQLAADLNSEADIIYSKVLMLAYLMYIEKDAQQAFRYLQNNDGLKQYYLNRGIVNYYYTIGNIYRYSHQLDSAIFYYSKVLPKLEDSYDPHVQKVFFKEVAECYRQTNEPLKSIEFYEKALSISLAQKDFKTTTEIYMLLSGLHEQTGQFGKAYKNLKQSVVYNDTLEHQAIERKIALMEVDRENKKHEKDLKDLETERLRTRNLQYIGITIAIAAIFTFMLLMGMFPISKFTIKLLSFFAFICLFEFIVLLVEFQLHKIAHGEPLKIWIGKILLIAALVPLQHFLEHGVVRFLASQRLLRIRQKLSIRRMWLNIKTNLKKSASLDEAGIEEDTAVL